MKESINIARLNPQEVLDYSPIQAVTLMNLMLAKLRQANEIANIANSLRIDGGDDKQKVLRLHHLVSNFKSGVIDR